jgi:hypothetical protein
MREKKSGRQGTTNLTLENRNTLVIEEEEQKPEWKKSFKATRTTTRTTTSSFSTTCILTSSLVRNREKVTDAHLCYTLAQQRYHKKFPQNKTKPKTPKETASDASGKRWWAGTTIGPQRRRLSSRSSSLVSVYPSLLPQGLVTSTPPSSWTNEKLFIQVPSLLFHPPP